MNRCEPALRTECWPRIDQVLAGTYGDDMTDTLTVNVGEAKTRLSQLIAQAENGADVVIARHGQPAVRLMPVASRRKFGFMKLHIPDSAFFDPLSDEELTDWENGPIYPVDAA